MLSNIFILSNIFCAVTSVCPDYWTRRGSSCYYFATRPFEKATWHEAAQACLWQKSHLVIVDSKAENDFIKQYINIVHPLVMFEQFWTYGNDIHQENVWNWGFTPNKITTNFWALGQPSHCDNYGEIEDCMTVWQSYWNDENCDHRKLYICEMSFDNAVNIIG